MPNVARRAIALAALAAAIVAATVALDLPSAVAQSDESDDWPPYFEQTGRIVARRLADGRTEFGWQPTGGARVLPSARHFPADAEVDHWQSSDPVEVDGAEIGRIDARLNADGRIEFAFTPTDGERILTDARYFPAAPRPNRWLRSTEIAIGPPPPPSPYTAVSAGYEHTCGLRESGAIECWGRNDDGQINAPAGSFTAVSAGYWHTCAIRESDGAIECWGKNTRRGWNHETQRIVELYGGQTDAPAGSFSAVSAGNEHTCGLHESGEIECWGSNGNRQANAPAGSFSAVSAGYKHTCAIRAGSGAIECWGTFFLARDGGTQSPHDPPTAVHHRTMASNAFSAVVGNYKRICGLRTSGAIECWDQNIVGLPPNLRPSGRYTAISASASDSDSGSYYCGLRTDATIKCWLSNVYGQTDAPAGRFSAVSAGKWHTCGLRDDGAIRCWGWNKYGQTDAPAP